MSHHTLVHRRSRAAAAASGLCIALLCGGCPRSTVWLGKSELSLHDAGHEAPNDASDAALASAGGHAGGETSAGHDAGAAGTAASVAGAGGDTTLPATAGAGGSSGAAAGSGGASGSVASGTGGAGAAGGPAPSGPQLPSASEPCPTFATGTVKVLGVDVQLWVGASSVSRGAPLLIYWHGAGSNSGEPTAFFGAPVDDVVKQGGIVASPAVSTAKGDPDATSTWYTGDFALADEIVACAVQQRNIDPRRIYVTGCDYGAVQADSMGYARSGYIAAAVSNSGGAVSSSGSLVPPQMLQDPAHVPPVMTLHGPRANDVVIVDFADASLALTRDVVNHGGFAVDCDHQGGHCGAPADLQAAAWQFLQDHPFGVQPEPYAAGLPASFPSYCKIQ